MGSAFDACSPCCAPTVPPVNVPGTSGANAFSFTSGNVAGQFTVPSVGANVTVNVTSTAWMVVGQRVIIGQGLGGPSTGPANFQVVSIGSATAVTLQYLGYQGDVAAGSTISDGAVVTTASSPMFTTIAAQPTGSAYPMTTTPTGITIGGGGVTVTLPPGTYVLFGQVQFEQTAAKFNSAQLANFKLRRINNTPADLPNATEAFTIFPTGASTETFTLGVIDLPPTIYAATGTGTQDQIQIFGSLSAASDAGTGTISASKLVAIRVF